VTCSGMLWHELWGCDVAESTKRIAIITLSIELDEDEDAQQTAELAVELLQGDMNNQIALIDVDDTDGK